MNEFKFVAEVNGERQVLKLRNAYRQEGETIFDVVNEDDETLGYVLVTNFVSLINVETLRCNQKHKVSAQHSTPLDFGKFPLKPIPVKSIKDGEHAGNGSERANRKAS